MADVTISETLCFIVNKFSVVTKVQLKAILVGFYTKEELSDAKDLLFANSGKLKVEGLPRYVKRTKVDNRAKLINWSCARAWTRKDVLTAYPHMWRATWSVSRR